MEWETFINCNICENIIIKNLIREQRSLNNRTNNLYLTMHCRNETIDNKSNKFKLYTDRKNKRRLRNTFLR